MKVRSDSVSTEVYEAALRFAFTKSLSDRGLVPASARAIASEVAGTIVAELEAIFIRKKYHQEYKAIDCGPTDWWQAFRERWFPAWWLQRHPVKRRVEEVLVAFYRTCPHVHVNTSDKDHFNWMSTGVIRTSD